MVHLSQNGSPGNHPRGNKRPFSNAGFNNQTDNPRGGGAKFQRKSFGGTPNHGNFNNRNGGRNNGNNQNNFRGNFKNSDEQFNRSWEPNRNKGAGQQNKSASFADDSTKSPGKHMKLEDEQELNDTISNQFDNNLETSTTKVDPKMDLEASDSSEEEDDELTEEIEKQAEEAKKANMYLEASDTSEEEDEDDELTEEIEKQAEEKKKANEASVSSKKEIESTEAKDQNKNINTDSKANENAKNINFANCITVRGLKSIIKAPHLKEFFAKYGEVQHVKMLDSKHSSKAVVRFENEDSAQKALEVNGMLFQDYLITVCPGLGHAIIPENTIFLDNLPVDITIKEAWEEFELCLPVSRFLIHMAKSNYRTALVVLESADYKQLALGLKKITIKGRECTISDYKPNHTYMPKPGFRPMRFSNRPFGRQMHHRGTFQPRSTFHGPPNSWR